MRAIFQTRICFQLSLSRRHQHATSPRPPSASERPSQRTAASPKPKTFTLGPVLSGLITADLTRAGHFHAIGSPRQLTRTVARYVASPDGLHYLLDKTDLVVVAAYSLRRDYSDRQVLSSLQTAWWLIERAVERARYDRKPSTSPGLTARPARLDGKKQQGRHRSGLEVPYDGGEVYGSHLFRHQFLRPIPEDILGQILLFSARTRNAHLVCYYLDRFHSIRSEPGSFPQRLPHSPLPLIPHLPTTYLMTPCLFLKIVAKIGVGIRDGQAARNGSWDEDALRTRILPALSLRVDRRNWPFLKAYITILRRCGDIEGMKREWELWKLQFEPEHSRIDTYALFFPLEPGSRQSHEQQKTLRGWTGTLSDKHAFTPTAFPSVPISRKVFAPTAKGQQLYIWRAGFKFMRAFTKAGHPHLACQILIEIKQAEIQFKVQDGSRQRGSRRIKRHHRPPKSNAVHP